jgi:hypothetical protein
MYRRAFIAGVAAAVIGRSIALDACGDKFLRVGRSARFRRYAAVHPSAILIYSPAKATRAGIDELKSTLKRAGHNAVALDHRASVAAALAASHYDVVIADYGDSDRLKADLQSAASQATLLPILDKAPSVVVAEARHQFQFLLTPHEMTKYDALAEIDRLMDTKRRGLSASK